MLMQYLETDELTLKKLKTEKGLQWGNKLFIDSMHLSSQAYRHTTVVFNVR